MSVSAPTSPSPLEPVATRQLSLALDAEPEEKNGADEAGPAASAITSSPADNPLPKPARETLGAQLRTARLAANMALEDVAAEIKIRAAYLTALEEGRYQDLPSPTYAIGFVRSYAQALSLPVETMVARCKQDVAALSLHRAPNLAMPAPVAETHLPSGKVIAFSLLGALALYLLATFAAPEAPPAPMPALAPPPETVAAVPVPAAPPVSVPEQAPQTATPLPPTAPAPAEPAAPTQTSAAPQPAAPPAGEQEPTSATTEEKINPPAEGEKEDDAVVALPAPPSAAAPTSATQPAASAAAPAQAVPSPSRIKLKAKSETMVRIFDAKGKLLAERVIKAGEAFYVPDHAGYTLATSNAAATVLQIDGHDMPPLGEADEAMHNIPLNPSELLEYLQ